MHSQLLNRVVFLDRDGVINHDSPNYIKSWKEFEFLPRSLSALKLLKENNFSVILITNQSAVSRRLITLQELDYIHHMLKQIVMGNGGYIKDIFYCPHGPEDNCYCRKPKPGLVIKAKEQYGIEIKNAYMVGDSARDIECSKKALCGYNILVKTGNGLSAEKMLYEKGCFLDYVAEDLYDAAEWIINNEGGTLWDNRR